MGIERGFNSSVVNSIRRILEPAVTVEHNETQWVLRLEGDCGMNTAAELKALLLAGLASGRELSIELAKAGEIDVTVLQLLWAAQRAAARQQMAFQTRVPEAVAALARQAGLESFPGQALPGQTMEDAPGLRTLAQSIESAGG
jgi:ABC-type transporter Mla MlaB component